MRRQVLGIVGAAIAVSLTVPGSALARAGDRTFAETYPAATALCLRATAHPATLGRKLEPQAAAVIAACQTLDNAFLPLVSTVDAAEAALLNTIAAQKLLVATACPRPVPTSEKAACQTARATAHTTDAAARSTRQTAVTAFHTAIEANRTTFWSTISSLRSTATTA
ncbi:MAG TPA: hypothetical protein VNC12_07550 [Solirubrobacteraceae bacterium]|nr:hypothetical protein [Solirubrobacteraceae bacterium]